MFSCSWLPTVLEYVHSTDLFSRENPVKAGEFIEFNRDEK
jgi:hypothetical protein